jgi:membrane protein implicated in regulation of membrane protease activity
MPLFLTNLASETAEGLQNVYTPISLKTHLIFCLFATVLYLTLFYRRGSWHYIFMMAAIDATFATQTSLCSSNTSITVLAVVEVVLLAFAGVFYARYSKEQKKLEAAENETAAQDKARRKSAEKAQKKIDGNPVDNAFDDGDE